MSHYAYPGAHPAARPASRVDPLVPLGVVCLVLGALELGWFVYKLVAALVAGLLDYLQRTFLPGAVPAPVSTAVGRVTETARTLTGLEVASLIPCAGLALVLIVIAIGLLVKRKGWLFAARVWCGVALGVLLASLAIQLFAIVPQLLEIEHWVDTHLASSTSRGRSSVVAPTMFWMLGHSALLAVWPFVLWFWAGSLRWRRGSR